MTERCENCDRVRGLKNGECAHEHCRQTLMTLWQDRHMQQERVDVGAAMTIAAGDCAAHSVDWRARALAAEAVLAAQAARGAEGSAGMERLERLLAQLGELPEEPLPELSAETFAALMAED